jgi:hypothetical protein
MKMTWVTAVTMSCWNSYPSTTAAAAPLVLYRASNEGQAHTAPLRLLLPPLLLVQLLVTAPPHQTWGCCTADAALSAAAEPPPALHHQPSMMLHALLA